MKILINSSKTMAIQRPLTPVERRLPALQSQADQIHRVLAEYDSTALGKLMHLSPALAVKTHQLVEQWGPDWPYGLALDTFQGDIYKGLRAHTLSLAAREYADEVLRVLSGHYGVVRPFDAIQPYRLELGYRLKIGNAADLYGFWGQRIADAIADQTLINLASEEYARAVLPFVPTARVISPLFLTRQDGAEPTFVAIHAKLARGLCARWLLEQGSSADIRHFNAVGYVFDPQRSTATVPVFVRRGPLTLQMIAKA